MCYNTNRHHHHIPNLAISPDERAVPRTRTRAELTATVWTLPRPSLIHYDNIFDGDAQEGYQQCKEAYEPVYIGLIKHQHQVRD